MLCKLTTALFIGLAASAALDLSRRQEGASGLACYGDCGPEVFCLWICPAGTVCGKTHGDCPVALPTPIDPPQPGEAEPEPVPEPSEGTE